MEKDLKDKILVKMNVNFAELADRALKLSEQYGQNVPIKTIDLLHIAMMQFGFDHFITADKQQHEFAILTGIHSIFLPP